MKKMVHPVDAYLLYYTNLQSYEKLLISSGKQHLKE